jgi:hypothetical protein
MDLETILSTLRGVLVELEERLPAADVQNAWSMIDAGEPGVAFENLCTQLDEYDVPVPPVVLTQHGDGRGNALAADPWNELRVAS